MCILKIFNIPFLSVLFISFLVGCASNPTSNSANNFSNDPGNNNADHGILWKVEKTGLTPSYVFGTMHSEDPRVINLPEEVNSAFSDAKIFAMEMILDEKNSQQILQGMYFKDGRTLRSVTSEEIYRQSIVAMAKKEMPEKIVNLMKPWAVFTILSMPEQKTGLFLDVLLYQSALKHGKEIVGLETMSEQLGVFDEMEMETQVSLLKSTLESSEDLDKILEETIELYLTHDLQKILDLNDRYMALLDKKVADEFNQRLLIDRNIRMAKRMMPLLEKGNSFVAIGTLHLPGKTGVLQILRNLGYNVTAEY